MEKSAETSVQQCASQLGSASDTETLGLEAETGPLQTFVDSHGNFSLYFISLSLSLHADEGSQARPSIDDFYLQPFVAMMFSHSQDTSDSSPKPTRKELRSQFYAVGEFLEDHHYKSIFPLILPTLSMTTRTYAVQNTMLALSSALGRPLTDAEKRIGIHKIDRCMIEAYYDSNRNMWQSTLASGVVAKNELGLLMPWLVKKARADQISSWSRSMPERTTAQVTQLLFDNRATNSAFKPFFQRCRAFGHKFGLWWIGFSTLQWAISHDKAWRVSREFASECSVVKQPGPGIQELPYVLPVQALEPAFGEAVTRYALSPAWGNLIGRFFSGQTRKWAQWAAEDRYRAEARE